MAVPLVSRREAMKKPTHHQFVPGLGHVVHGQEPELPAGYAAVAGKSCAPTADAGDKTLHFLQPSHGGPQKRMIWLAEHQSWAPADAGQQGNRMAWTADYLGRAGWSYIGPADAIQPPPLPRRRR